REPVGGPVGLTLALLLARRGMASVVFDARTVEQARGDQRLLALSRGSLQTLSVFTELPSNAVAPIRTVIVSSAGEFGRAVIDDSELGAEILGVTIRYGDLVAALSVAAEASPLITLRRPLKVTAVRQSPSHVDIDLEHHQTVKAPLALSAEGFGHGPIASASHAALVADLDIAGIESGQAYERFTRDGPLALLPLPVQGPLASLRWSLVWCMTQAQAERRGMLGDQEFIGELSAQLGEGKLRVVAVHSRKRHPLHQQMRDAVVEHRVVYLGNAAQTLHPVAGQGLNLGLRDAAVLAEKISDAYVSGTDAIQALASYAQSRRMDRAAIVALTRAAPSFFSTRFAPIALVRSIGLTALGVVPNLRRDFARLLMFGVRF
ncbi:MAG: FAD-dependent monooxygenase, partial [Burkholderiaceae bacterium]